MFVAAKLATHCATPHEARERVAIHLDAGRDHAVSLGAMEDNLHHGVLPGLTRGRRRIPSIVVLKHALPPDAHRRGPTLYPLLPSGATPACARGDCKSAVRGGEQQ